MNEDFAAELQNGYKGDCPHCGRYAQVYRRRLHHTVARQLIQLYRLNGANEYVHVRDLVTAADSGAGDFTKAKYWGLITEKQHFGTDKKASGYWRLTPNGVDFVNNLVRIQEIAIVFDDTVLGFSGNWVGIKQCLSDKFDYFTIMNN